MDTFQIRTRIAHALALGLAITMLGACGGGGNVRSNPPPAQPAGPPPASTPPPPSATGVVYGPGFSYVDKPISGDLRINANAEVGLDANVTGSVHNDGRMIVWNPSISEANSHVRIGGNYLQGASAVLEVHLGGPEASDLRIAGNAALAGTLRIAMPCCGIGDMYNASNYSLTPNVLHADGTISGQFDTVILPSVFVSGTLDYARHDITMNLVPVSASKVAGGNANPVTRVGAAALDSVIARSGWQNLAARGSSSVAERQLLGSLQALWHLGDSAQAARSFDSLTGQAYASVQAWMLDNGEAMDLRATVRSRQPGADGAWMRAGSGLAAQTDAGAMSASARRDGVQTGMDHWFGNGLLVGFAWGNEQASARFARGGDQAQWQLPSMTAYAHYRRGRWHATGLFGRSEPRLGMQRWIDLGDVRHPVGAMLAMDRLQGALETGREFRFGSGRLTPYAGLSHAAVRNQAFVEQGHTGFELAVEPATLTSTTADIGLRYAHAWRWDGDGWAQFGLDGAYGQRVDASNALQASFTGMPGLPFVLPDHAEGRETRRMDLRLEFGRDRKAPWFVFLGGNWMRSGRESDLGWQMGAQRRF